MECKNIPPAPFWADASKQALSEYRAHLADCSACRNRVFFEAPDALLHELQNRELPKDFWMGFWPSLRARRSQHAWKPVLRRSLLRWTAVLILGTFLGLQVGSTSRLYESADTFLQSPPAVSISSNYPLLEELQNPGARYLILQHAKNETIIMVFDPNLEL